MNKKAGAVDAILTAFIGLVLFVALMPVISILTTQAINSVNSGADISNKSVIVILLGMIGLLVVIGLIYGIIKSMQKPDTQQY